MTAACHATAGKASRAPSEFCTGSGKGFHPITAVMRAVQILWPSKTALELAARTGACERSAKYWLARKCDLSAEHLAELLRSDAGLAVLEALMGDARPAWYAALRRRVREERLEAQLQALADEMADIKQERARAAKPAR